MLSTLKGESTGIYTGDVGSQGILVGELIDLVDSKRRRVELVLIGKYGKREVVGEAYDGQYYISGRKKQHTGIELKTKFRGKGLGKYLYAVYSEFFEPNTKEFAPANNRELIKLYLSVGYYPTKIIHTPSGSTIYGFNDTEQEVSTDFILENIGNRIGIVDGERYTIEFGLNKRNYDTYHNHHLETYTSETQFL